MTAATPQLIRVRDAIVAKIREALPDFDVAGHYGRFTDEQMHAFGASAPAVRVAILGLSDPTGAGEDYLDYVLAVGIYVATSDGADVGDRDVQALCAVEAITLLSHHQRWGAGDICLAARSAVAQNMYSAAAMADGFALWAIDLRQPVRLQPEDDSAAVTLRAWLGVAPNVGLGHEADYVELGRPPA